MTYQYAVLGGGISGLSAAFYFKQFGYKPKVLLIEGSNHLGGWIDSWKTSNGTQFELGPRTLRVAGNAGTNTLQLAEALNLEDKINHITYDHISSKRRLIKVNNRLHELPNSFKMVLSKVPPFSKPLLMQLVNDLRAPTVISSDESLYSFIQRRFGTELAKYAIDPLCRGIYAGNAKNLSVMALSQRMYNVEQKYGSVIKGMLLDRSGEQVDKTLKCSLSKRAKKEKWSVWSLKGGLQTLVKAIEDQIVDNTDLVRNSAVTNVRAEGKKIIITTGKKTYIVDKVISCLPSIKLKPLIKEWNPDLYTLLDDIQFVTVAVVNLEFSKNIIKEPAFGYLVPSSEPDNVLGVIYDSCTFPQNGKTILTVMMGGYWFEELFGKDPSPELILKTAVEEVQSTLNTKIHPVSYKVSILKNCIPQYSVGHIERVDNARKVIRNSGAELYLSGYSYDGVGVNDAIYNTKKVVKAILQ